MKIFPIALWAIAALVIFGALCHAWADECPPGNIMYLAVNGMPICIRPDPDLKGLEKRIEDLEINLAAQIANSGSSTPARACEKDLADLKERCKPIDYGHSFEDCMAKQGRFGVAPGATNQSKLYAIWLCGHNQGVRWHSND